MEGIERAAVLLLGMGEEHAAEVLRHLEPKQVQKVGVAMTKLANISKEEIKAVVGDFINTAEQQTSLAVDAETYIRNVLTNALGVEKAKGFIDRILETNEDGGLSTLKWMDAQTITDLVRNEHPQVIATILTYIDSEQAAEVLKFFSDEKRIDLTLRMSAIEAIKPEALAELGELIQDQLSNYKGGQKAALGGVRSVAELINNLDGGIDGQILEGIKAVNEELHDQIQEQMFLFENLADVDGRSIQTLLRDVKTDVLALALKGADEIVKEKIFTNMSSRAADLLRDDLDAMGPVKVSEVEAAQKEILAVARKLAESGEIALGGKGGEEMI